MYFLENYGVKKICLFKQGRNSKESKEYIDKGVIDNHFCLVVGSPGSGKSVFSNVMANEVRVVSKPVRTLIYITEKEGEELANAFHVFKPIQEYHNELLKEQKQDAETVPEKIWHPMTFNFPFRQKLPPINLMAYSVKRISEYGFDAIIPSESEIASERSIEFSRSLDDDATIYDFLWLLYQDIIEEGSNKQSIRAEDMFLPVEGSGDKRTVKNVRDALKGFRLDYMIHPESSPYVMDFVAMCNDSDHIHHFTTKFIRSRKRKVFAILEFINGIDEAIKSGKVKNQLVLVFEEMKILVPDTGLKGYELQLLSILKRIFSRIRTKAFVIATAQSYFDINRDFTGTFDKVFLGKLNPNDIRVLIKDYQFRVNDTNKLYLLKTGDFVLWESNPVYEDERLSDKIMIDVPVFANHEQGEDFFTKYKQNFPKKCRDNLKAYKDLNKMHKAAEDKREKEMREWQKQKKLKEESKKLNKEGKIEEAMEKNRELKKEKKSIIMQQVYDIVMANAEIVDNEVKFHKDWSWREVARHVSGMKSHVTAAKYFNIMHNTQKDKEFLPDLSKDNPNRIP